MRVEAVFQGNQVVLRAQQRLFRLRRLAGIGSAVAELGIGNAVDFLILFEGFLCQFDGFVEIGDIEIGVGDIVDQSQARVRHILPRGLVFPDLRVGGGTEFAPQIQFVAQAELAAEGVAVAAGFQVFGCGRTQRAAERRHQIRPQNIRLIQGFIDADGRLFQIDIVFQSLRHQSVELPALVDFPPVAVHVVAFGGFRRAHDLPRRFECEVLVGAVDGARA